MQQMAKEGVTCVACAQRGLNGNEKLRRGLCECAEREWFACLELDVVSV
jgi:hypothetical protein